ncbi:MAG: NAD+ synthase [Nitrospirales bacterium]|nr:NAD+ synthase [Nitrospirales bacterium]
MGILRLAMAQMNPTVGDVEGNVRAITTWIRKARQAKADVVVFPELAITGYPPEDLVLRRSFLRENRKGLDIVTQRCQEIVAIIGFIDEDTACQSPIVKPKVLPSGPCKIFNAAALVANQRWVGTYRKMILPNYGVFDESRYFYPGERPLVCMVNGVMLGITICEDMWYANGPIRTEVIAGGADVIVNINASPFQIGKRQTREQMLVTQAREYGVVVSYTNMVGGQDELIFDGNSLLVDHHGDVLAHGKAFDEDLLIVDVTVEGKGKQADTKISKKIISKNAQGKMERIIVSKTAAPLKPRRRSARRSVRHEPLADVYQALVLGVRDYVKKNMFQQVVIGLSGGIDSALTLIIAADALGPSQVLSVCMPSPFTSKESREDAGRIAKQLDVPLLRIPITKVLNNYLGLLSPAFQGRAVDTTEENLQARIRGNILMALSNKFGYLVLTTGNKSEMSVGYATLYGDMAGGFAVIKDVSKTLVYELAQWRNHQSSQMYPEGVIPKRILEREPSAELRANQIDQDTLPPYDILDPILEAYVEEDRSVEDIVAMGFTRATVTRVLALVDRSEYKRRQAPLGIKITQRALGKDRRVPVTNRYTKY